MQMELHCSSCAFSFSAAPHTPATEILERLLDEGRWIALAEGETFAEMVFAALTARGRIRCPECARPVSLSAESLDLLNPELFPSPRLAPRQSRGVKVCG